MVFNGFMIARIMVWTERARYYMSLLQFMFVSYMAIKMGFPLWVLVVGGVLFVPWLIFDIKIVLPATLEYMALKNPEWNKLRKEIKQRD